MISEQANAYINGQLGKFRVEKENLSRAIINDNSTEALRISHTMSQLLIHVRSSIRENMVDNRNPRR